MLTRRLAALLFGAAVVVALVLLRAADPYAVRVAREAIRLTRKALEVTR